jgi:hypothetical protein
MKRRLLRTLLALATFAVVWLVVSPASASPSMAPLCDPRGAITFAPPPQIQDAELSLDIPADCATDSPSESRNVVPGRGPQIDISFSQEPVAASGTRLPALIFAERLPARVAVDVGLRPGVRASLERPPRG